MITLFGNAQRMQLVTSSVANLAVTVEHVTQGGPTNVYDGAITTIVSATTTDIVAPAGTGLRKSIHGMTLRNTHATLANTITLQVFDGTATAEVFKVTLAAGEQAIFNGISGWTYFNAQGLPKVSQSQGSSAAALSAVNIVVLANDVTNNNAVANTLQDVTGLSFPVIAGEIYQFEFFIDYTAAATTTGSRWALQGPAFSRLTLQSALSLTTTANAYNNINGYDLPAAAAASSGTTLGNLAYLAGFIAPSVDGSVIARFASEVAASAIIAKAGSMIKWTRVK